MNKKRGAGLLKEYMVFVLKGFCMGAADVIPGVSGGTMAFIMGIYERLIRAVSSFDLHFFSLIFSLRIREAFEHVSMAFLACLGTGILLAIFSMARLLSWLLENRPVMIWSFFFGLIVASVYTVSRHMEAWRAVNMVWAALGALITYLLVGMAPASTPDAPWFLFLSGAVAICAMILPGISGAFILVLLGKYLFVLEAVNNRDFVSLFIVAAGAALGLAAFSRLLKWCFKRHHDLIVALLTGLMTGSLRKVWPWKSAVRTISDEKGHVVNSIQNNFLPSQWSMEVTFALLLAVAGFSLVIWLSIATRTKGSGLENINE